MKYLIAICALILSLSVGAYEPEHLKHLKKTNECLKCDLSYANLERANLGGSIGRVLTPAMPQCQAVWWSILTVINLEGYLTEGVDAVPINQVGI